MLVQSRTVLSRNVPWFVVRGARQAAHRQHYPGARPGTSAAGSPIEQSMRAMPLG